MKVLLAYYSRTNITKKLAEDIADRLDADIEEITSEVDYSGKMGFMRGGKDAVAAKIIDIGALSHDPSGYDLVIIGTPVWASKAATPVISYIKQNEGKFNDVKFFATAKSSGFEGTFKQMEDFVGKAPLATLALKSRQTASGNYEDELKAFLE